MITYRAGGATAISMMVAGWMFSGLNSLSPRIASLMAEMRSSNTIVTASGGMTLPAMGRARIASALVFGGRAPRAFAVSTMRVNRSLASWSRRGMASGRNCGFPSWACVQA